MPLTRRHSLTALAASLVLMLALAGCADDGVVYDNTPSGPANGNWQVSSSTMGVALPKLSGALVGTPASGGTTLTGVLHADATTGCATASDAIAMTGSIDASGATTMMGAVAGGTLTISGTLATDGRSIEDATYNVTGGSCAFAQAASATMQNYSPVTGSYTGSFTDPGGTVIDVTASLTQAPSGDTDGNFELSGTGNFGSNPCFTSPVTVVNSQVTGGSFILTYADSVTGNVVSAAGTFSQDGKTLTVTQWTLSGPCGADTGTGTLTQQ
jgi:hypothetical protein